MFDLSLKILEVLSLKMNDLLWLNYKTRLNIINKWHFIFRMLKRELNYRLIKRI